MKIFFNIEYVVPDGTLVASLSISTDMSSLKGFRLVPGIAGNHLMETNQLIKIGNGVAESQWLGEKGIPAKDDLGTANIPRRNDKW